MSDRYKGVVVTFTHGIKDEDADKIIHAIECLKGVLDVPPRVQNVDDHMNMTQAKNELRQKMWELLK